jgi:DNA-binding phage protein
MFREGQRVSQVAKALGIGRASVYRALADAGVHL